MPIAAPSPSPAELLDLATRTAENAAHLLVDGLRRGGLTVDTKSSATDMVTEIDRAAESLIAEMILGERPDDGLVGEEGTNRPTSSGVRWVVDPIDGTTNYLYGHPGFAVSIAAEILDGDPSGEAVTVAGVVWVPLLDEVYTATIEGGAHRNGASIHASVVTDPATALVASGFSYDPDRRRRQAEVLTQVLPQVRDLRRMGAASVDLCSVACGRLLRTRAATLGPRRRRTHRPRGGCDRRHTRWWPPVNGVHPCRQPGVVAEAVHHALRCRSRRRLRRPPPRGMPPVPSASVDKGGNPEKISGG